MIRRDRFRLGTGLAIVLFASSINLPAKANVIIDGWEWGPQDRFYVGDVPAPTDHDLGSPATDNGLGSPWTDNHWGSSQDNDLGSSLVDGLTLPLEINPNDPQFCPSDPPSDPVPEPASLALLATALIGLVAVRRRKGQGALSA